MKKERDDRRVMNTNKEESNKHVWCCEIHNRYKYHNIICILENHIE